MDYLWERELAFHGGSASKLRKGDLTSAWIGSIFTIEVRREPSPDSQRDELGFRARKTSTSDSTACCFFDILSDQQSFASSFLTLNLPL